MTITSGERSFYQGISVTTWERSLAAAEPWHKRHLRVMRELLEDMIDRFYDGELTLPVLRVASTDSDTRPGEYRSADRTGSFAEIRVNPRVVDGTLLTSCSERGARRYLADVLLHELVHAWQGRAGGQGGHGSAFAAECNRIGRLIGLPTVEANDVQSGRDRPLCSSWPRCVRPAGYYQQEAKAHFVPAPSRRRAAAPLTAADRAFLVYQYDQERIAATERRERIRRTVARVRRELASHHGSR